jgi:hypothetical protein
VGFSAGQVVIEYVLLLTLALSLSLLIMKALVGAPGSPNGIRSTWAQMIQAIGNDVPGK